VLHHSPGGTKVHQIKKKRYFNTSDSVSEGGGRIVPIGGGRIVPLGGSKIQITLN
jgi:hypothetical protein